MTELLIERLRQLPDAKKLAIAIYGESVASYRYSVLAEKALTPEHRRIFNEMKEEEHQHQVAVERLARKLFPDSDFLLTPEDKDFVIVGARLLEVTDESSFRKAMEFLYDTERRTGEFYDTLYNLMDDEDLRAFLKEMAEECYVHAESLRKLTHLETRN